MSIARVAEPSGSLQEAKEWGLDREDLLGIYRNLLLTRGVEERGHILYRQGKIPGSFYTGRGNEASAVAIATAMARDDVGTPLHRNMGVHIVRGVEPWRILANYMGRAGGPAKGEGRERPYGRPPPRARRDGLAPAGDAPGRGRLRARVPDSRGEARRGHLVRGGLLCARRRARGDELRSRPPTPGRVRLRQQRLGLLDPGPPRVRGRAPGRPCRRLRLRGRGGRRHRRARGLPRGQARDREGAPGRRADADRERHAPDGGPRRPRRRLLRPQGGVRGVGKARPDRALPPLAARAHRLQRARKRTRSSITSSATSTRRSSGPRPLLRPTRARSSTGSTPSPKSSTTPTTCSAMAEKTYLQAISDGLRLQMRHDKRVFLIGEDIGVYGGAFKVTQGFQEEFGPWRVLDAPLSETAIVGGATGAAMMGLRPVAEMQFADFISCAWDHLVTIAAKQHWRAGTPVPITVRLPSGGGFSGGPFHSQNPESSFAHIPGLKCVCPATPEDAKGLIIAAIEDPNPVLFFEHKHLYRRSQGRGARGALRDADRRRPDPSAGRRRHDRHLGSDGLHGRGGRRRSSTTSRSRSSTCARSCPGTRRRCSPRCARPRR